MPRTRQSRDSSRVIGFGRGVCAGALHVTTRRHCLTSSDRTRLRAAGPAGPGRQSDCGVRRSLSDAQLPPTLPGWYCCQFNKNSTPLMKLRFGIRALYSMGEHPAKAVFACPQYLAHTDPRRTASHRPLRPRWRGRTGGPAHPPCWSNSSTLLTTRGSSSAGASAIVSVTCREGRPGRLEATVVLWPPAAPSLALGAAAAPARRTGGAGC